MSGVSSIDSQPHNFSINFCSTYTYRSIIGGIISLCYITIGIAIFYYKINVLVHREHISYNTDIRKGFGIERLSINSSNFRIFLKNSSDNKPIDFDQLGSLGLKAVLTRLILYGNYTSNYTQIPAVKCNSSEREICIPWSQEDFLRGNTQFQIIQQEEDSEVYRRLTLEIQRCNISIDEGCAIPTTSFEYGIVILFRNNQVLLNNSLINQSILPQKGERILQPHIGINPQRVVALNLLFKRAIIQTDYSLLSQYMNLGHQIIRNQSWFYDEEFFQEIEQAQSDLLLRIYLKRSPYTHFYTRKFEKFDSMLGKFFGELSFIGLIIFCLTSGYNHWSFQQNIKKKLQIKYIQPNLYDYYLYSIKKLISKICFCCMSSLKQELRQIDRCTRKMDQKLDYFQLLQKVQRIELMLKSKLTYTKSAEEQQSIQNMNPLLNQQNEIEQQKTLKKENKNNLEQEMSNDNQIDEQNLNRKLLSRQRFSINEEDIVSQS